MSSKGRLFFNVLFIFEREREREREGGREGQKERETQNLKQDPGSGLSPTRGSNSGMARS